MGLDKIRPDGIRLKSHFFFHIIQFYHQFWLKNLSSLKTEEFFGHLTPQIQNTLIDYLYQKPVFEKFQHFFEGTTPAFRREMAKNMDYTEFKR